jgi:hypothetical protein
MAKTSIITNKLTDTVTEGVPDGAGTVMLVCSEDGVEITRYFLPDLTEANRLKSLWDT